MLAKYEHYNTSVSILGRVSYTFFDFVEFQAKLSAAPVVNMTKEKAMAAGELFFLVSLPIVL